MSRLAGARAQSRKQRRYVFLAIGAGLLVLATALVVLAIGEGGNHFRTPTMLAEKPIAPGVRFRLGGLVADGSVEQLGDATTRFVVADGQGEVTVTYRGILPDLFREGQGVITAGTLDAEGAFTAVQVLAKHDENYIPPELAEALEDSGHPGAGKKAIN